MRNWLKRLKWIFIPKTCYITIYARVNPVNKGTLALIVGELCGEGRSVVDYAVEALTTPLDSDSSEDVTLIVSDTLIADNIRKHLTHCNIKFTERAT